MRVRAQMNQNTGKIWPTCSSDRYDVVQDYVCLSRILPNSGWVEERHLNMRRREFLKAIAMSATGAMAHAVTEKKSYPNIVFILADDLGFGDVATQNPESKIPTPNLDRLAEQGIRFTDAHSPSAVCSPTRYGILTGRYAWRTPLKNSVLWPWDRPLIEADRLTVGDMLKEWGYNTACIGKWHLGWDWSTTDGSAYAGAVGVYEKEARGSHAKKIDYNQPINEGPIARGFDCYFGDDVPNFPPYCFIENDHTVGVPSTEKPKSMFGWEGVMVKDWDLTKVMPAITKKSVAYIQRQSKATPFFLYMPLTAPHTPIAPTDEFIGKSAAGRYGDFVHEVDWTVGQVMNALEKQGLADNTLLIFTSDNGSPARDGEDMNGQPRSVHKYGHIPSHIYRGIKADVWEGGHRIPFIARWPQHIAPGSTSDQLICSIDLMATCADIVSYPLPRDAAEDSVSMLSALLRGTFDTPRRNSLIHHSAQGMFALRQGKWKFIDGKGSGGWSGKGEESDPEGQLYDIQDDPSEKNNLYNKHPEIVERLRKLLENQKQAGRTRTERIS
jgi:arylsulfatase A